MILEPDGTVGRADRVEGRRGLPAAVDSGPATRRSDTERDLPLPARRQRLPSGAEAAGHRRAHPLRRPRGRSRARSSSRRSREAGVALLRGARAAGRSGIQIAFASMFALIALIVLLSAIWFGLNFANRLVAPIRRLIHATDQVATGNFYVQVPVRTAEGDLAHLGETFNKMTSELRRQHDGLTAASDLIDRRRRFTEAVLAGRFGGRHRHRRARASSRSSTRPPSAARRRPRDARSAQPIADDRCRRSPRWSRSAQRTRQRLVQEQIQIIRSGKRPHHQRPGHQRAGARRGAGSRRHARRHHRSRLGAAHLRLGRRRAPHRPRDQEPADPDPALGRAHPAQIRQGHHHRPRGLRSVHRHDRPPGRRHQAHGRRVLVLRPHAEADDRRRGPRRDVRQVVFLMRIAHPEIEFVGRSAADAGRRRRSTAGSCRRRSPTSSRTPPRRSRPCRRRSAGRAASSSPLDETPTEFVVIDVTDNGKGFPAEGRQRLLEPYMTTREGGTGLGLPIVGKILEEHGGGIELLDNPAGRGGQVRMWIPKTTRDARQAPPADFGSAAEPTQSKRMSADILVVDDEADIRELVAGILRTRATARARPAPPTRRLPRSRRGGRISSSSTSGCRAAGSTGCRCSTSSRAASRSAGRDDLGPRQHRDRRLGHQGRRLRLHREAVQGRPARARRRARARSLAPEARGQGSARPAPCRRAGSSAIRRSINQLRQTVERVAPTNARILITGAPGSGKELAARTIHAPVDPRQRALRRRQSAATITPENMEAELFGVEGGEGQGRRVGALEEAHGGTLYIDEIADMPRETQNRILRVLVDQNFQRVGGTTRVHVDVRIISSSSRDLAAEIAAGPLPRGPVPPPQRRADPGAVPVRAARGRAGADRVLHGPDLLRDRPAASGASPRTRWRCCSRTTGPATSASCATTSSG